MKSPATCVDVGDEAESYLDELVVKPVENWRLSWWVFQSSRVVDIAA